MVPLLTNASMFSSELNKLEAELTKGIMEGGVNKFIEASDTEFSDLEDSSMEIEGTKR